MKSRPRQSTIGFLMIVVAAVALFLAIPRETWSSLGSWALTGAAMMVLSLAGFAVMVFGCKLVSGIGLAIGDAPPSTRGEPPRAEKPPWTTT